jgi:hypothetical protein
VGSICESVLMPTRNTLNPGTSLMVEEQIEDSGLIGRG